MKKILFAAMAALAITSCSQNEEIVAPNQKAEIGFNTVVNKAPRATPTVNANFQNFKVYAYNTGTSSISGIAKLNTTTFMPGVNVEKTGDPAAWTVDGTYYWPTATNNVQFFAYSPMASTALDGWSADTQYPSFSYTVNPVATQEDLLIAQATDKTRPTDDKAVDLTFQHILTKINFSAKGETDKYAYTIASIKIGNVYKTNTYTFNGTGNTPTGTWGADPTDQLNQDADFYVYAYDADKKDVSGTTANNLAKSDESNSLLLLPQTLPDAAAIIVNYSVKDANGNEIFNGNGEVSLKGVTWEIGKSINYILKLSNNGKEVTFSPKVNDTWGNDGDTTEHPTPEQPAA